MVQAITNNFLYRTTDKIESNTLLNRGIVDVFGYAIPTSLNANNKHEARERIISSSIYFAIAFLSPVITMPLFNKFFLQRAGIIEKFNDKGVEIVRLSKKHLVEKVPQMEKGIEELIYDLRDNPNTSKKTREKFKDVEEIFNKVIEKFGDKEKFRETLLKTHTKIAIADYIITGLMLIATCFGVKNLTKKLTGRTGFSAEYEMADENYTKKKSQKHEENLNKKILISVAALLAGSVGVNKFVQKSFLKENPRGLMKSIKKNAAEFNYTNGIYMKMMPYFLLSVIGDFPPFLLSTRDKYELRDASVRLAMCTAIFFGGDAVLNRAFGSAFDKLFKTKLVNKENLGEKPSFWKKATAPIYSLAELSKKTDWDKEILKRTRKFGIGMYWLNLALVTLILGIGLPKALNKLLKHSVSKDLKQENGLNQKADYSKVQENPKTFKQFMEKK